ncbi:MAG: nicotinamide mononucleotide transporter, partial [Bacteroidaceae bacterium]|nr:nicotinamide mononucleotide transporter [Bacteroidaceae bacterium]
DVDTVVELKLTGTDADRPKLDAVIDAVDVRFTTALSVVGMFMLARKYVEQWWVWVAVDTVCVALYAYKALYATSLLYALYTVIAVAGYYKWRRMLQSSK